MIEEVEKRRANRRAARRAARGVTLRVLALLLVASAAHAYDASYDIQPRVLRLGEAATLSFSLSGLDNPPAPHLPTIDGALIQQAGRQQSFTMNNGAASGSVTFNYRIVPTRGGDLRVPSFEYTAGGQSVRTPEITIQVVDAEDDARDPTQAETLFARIETEPKTLYNQQMFDLVISIYVRNVNLGRQIELLNLPSSGLNLIQLQEIQGGREIVDNKVYDVRKFRGRMQALTAGRFNLAPVVRVGMLVRRQSDRGFGGFFDHPFFGGGVQTQPLDLRPEPLTLDIRPLPEQNRPADFSGAVGRFQFDVQARPLDVKVGDPITLTLRVAGQGNIEAVTAPHMTQDDRFKWYEPRLIDQQIAPDQSSGEKIFEQVVIPRSVDVSGIPALTFCFFNPDAQRYDTITRGPFPITVAPSASGETALMQTATALEPTTRVLGRDIVYLKPAPSNWRWADERPWYARRATWALQLVPVLAVIGVAFVTGRRRELERDIARARRQQAPKFAREGLRKAEEAVGQGDRAGYYEALWAALSAYFGHRLNLPPGAVEAGPVVERLRKGGLDDTLCEGLRKTFEACEEARFAHGGDSAWSETERATDRARIRELGEALRRCERIKL